MDYLKLPPTPLNYRRLPEKQLPNPLSTCTQVMRWEANSSAPIHRQPAVEVVPAEESYNYEAA